MKNLKKILVFMLILATIFCFVACNKDNENEQTTISEIAENHVTLLIVSADNTELARYEKTLGEGYVSDFLVAIADEEGSTFAYDSSTSGYGQFVNTVTVSTDPDTYARIGLFPDATKNEFCAFFHTLSDVKYADFTVDTKIYSEKPFYSSASGVSTTPLIDNAVYMLTITTW